MYPAGWAVKHWPLRRVQVSGDSMRPGLQPGDRLLVVLSRRLRRGDVIAVTDPREPTRIVVKRVAALGPDGVTVLGDAPNASTDSRIYGPVPLALVHGRAVYRYWPEDRRGRILRQ